MITDVDRLVVGEDAGLECKTASDYNADKWKDGEIPPHYLIQCCHYMAVTGKSAWYIAASMAFCAEVSKKSFAGAVVPYQFPFLQMGLFLLVLFGMVVVLSVWMVRRQKSNPW